MRFNKSFEKEVELNQILPSTGGSKVSVTVHNNLMYFSNGLSLTLLEIPRMFNDSHFLPELLLLKADVMLKAISYPYLFNKGRFKKENFIFSAFRRKVIWLKRLKLKGKLNFQTLCLSFSHLP